MNKRTEQTIRELRALTVDPRLRASVKPAELGPTFRRDREAVSVTGPEIARLARVSRWILLAWERGYTADISISSYGRLSLALADISA
jgi:DNA-binding transcriptional regulator YiaG